jgi:cell division protein FtsQ
VFALKGHKSGAAYPSSPSGTGEVDAGFILPRPLRRVVRFLVGLGSGRVRIPRHAGSLSLVAFMAATGFYGMSLGGHSHDVAQATTTAVGFGIENVQVSGNVQTSEIDILQQLGLDGTTSLVSLDVQEARNLVAQLPWVENVDVRKVYPDTISVSLKERTAFGIWQHGDELSLIERDGRVISALRDNKYSSLPLFVGRDAEVVAAEFYDSFSQWPNIKARVKAYVRVASRRWDLHLDNGVVVKLPEGDIAQAMQALNQMEADNQILERDIVAVDFRLADRTTVQLTPGAVERRQAAVDVRTKELKKAEGRI